MREALAFVGIIVASMLAAEPGTAAGMPSGAAFTYQGQLKEGGVPVSGFYNFAFRLYDQPEGGEPIPDGPKGGLVLDHKEVIGGLFTADLDFGPDVFQDYNELWLEIGVSPSARRGMGFTILAPRQRIGSAPGAIVAQYAEGTKGGSLSFGDMGHTSIGLDPSLPGLTAMDPMGMRVMTMVTMRECAISGEPCWFDEDCPLDETCEPCDECDSVPGGGGAMYFGVQDSSIAKEPGLSGLSISDGDGVRLLWGKRICSNTYPPDDEVVYCEAHSDCYGCCTLMKRCSISGALCETVEDCQPGQCSHSGNVCHTDRDCEPGRCRTTPWDYCYSSSECGDGPNDLCNDPPPEGCIGEEACSYDRPCTRPCYSDEDCPDEGAFCDYPYPSDCIVPEGRCSETGLSCYVNTDCQSGSCAGNPEMECWGYEHCWTRNEFGVLDNYGPCWGAERCNHPIPGGPMLGVYFGETDDHAVGYDPSHGGLVAVDAGGFRLISPEQTCSGTGESCETNEDCPEGGCSNNGYPCRDDGICGFNNTCTNPPPETCESVADGLRLSFGPGDNSSIGTETDASGLVLRHPHGARLMEPGDDGLDPVKLFFGATDDVFIGTEPGVSGLVLSHQGGVRLGIPIDPHTPVKLFFGATDDAYIGLEPLTSGLVLNTPGGTRLATPVPEPPKLIFGANDDAYIATDPLTSGLVFSSPGSARLATPVPEPPPRLIFGAADDTYIGADSETSGLVFSSPHGARLMEPGDDHRVQHKLFFGVMDDAYIGTDSLTSGLALSSPGSARLFNPQPEPPRDIRLLFGLTDETGIGTSPDALGLVLSDPTGVRIVNSLAPSENALIFGMGAARGVGESRIDTGVATDGMRFYSSRFFFDGGPVGIGTPTPAATLEVVNDGGAYAIRAETPEVALYAHRTSTAGTSPAVEGLCDSLTTDATAVQGVITSTTPGPGSAGVRGVNNGTSGAGAGVWGSQDGSGVGVYGTVPDGTAVLGAASGTSGANYGVRGRSWSPDGYGVYGDCGVGTGVYGIAGGTAGINYGVRGETNSPDGYAGYFVGGRNYFEGHVGIGTDSPGYPLEMASGAHVTADGVWTHGSDRNSKKNFQSLNKREILDKLAHLPITRWQYKREDGAVHHIGPVAQDFYDAFGLGHSRKHIGTADAEGVALAAIQGLYQVVKDRDAEIEALRAESAALRAELELLKVMVAKLANNGNRGG